MLLSAFIKCIIYTICTMERKHFKQILINFGYGDESIKKIMQGRMVPTLRKALVLQELHNIPVEAWKDIRSFIVHTKKDNNSMPDTAVHHQEETQN